MWPNTFVDYNIKWQCKKAGHPCKEILVPLPLAIILLKRIVPKELEFPQELLCFEKGKTKALVPGRKRICVPGKHFTWFFILPDYLIGEIGAEKQRWVNNGWDQTQVRFV